MAEGKSVFPWYQATAALLKRLGGKSVVEVVSPPYGADCGDGTVPLSAAALWRNCGAEVCSVAIEAASGETPLAEPTAQTDSTATKANPFESLSAFDRPIDLLYLDGWPVGTPGYQERHLEAYQAARGRFHDQTLVLVGDTARDYGGKAGLVLPAALQERFQVLLWGSLTLLGRTSPARVRDVLPRVGPPIPDDATFDEAIRLHQEGLAWEAEHIYRAVLKQWPDHPGALHLLGVALHQRGDHAAALRLIGKAIALEPGKAVYFNNYGAALHVLGRYVEALACFHHAVQLHPNYADAVANVGLAQESLGQDEAAMATLRRAMELQPHHPDAVKRVAELLQKQGKEDEALRVYETAIAAKPHAELSMNLANMLLYSGRLDRAANKYQEVIDLKADHADAWFNKGIACQGLCQIEESRQCLDRAIALRPERSLWRLRRATLGPALFRSGEEIDAYRAELDRTLDSRLASPPVRAGWNDLMLAEALPVFNLAYHGRNNRELKAKFASLCEAYFRDQPEPTGSGMTQRRRIGFLVTQRHEGIFLRCTKGILERLDGEDFEVVVLCSYGSVDTIRKEVRREGLRFVPFPTSASGAVQRIRDAACDLIYYWEIGSDSLNYLLPFARLAPVQCTSHGSLITSGVPAVQYFISSELTEPEGAEDHYTEKLWRSRTLLMYEGRLAPVSPVSRDYFRLPERGALYVCFQNPLKLHPDMDALLRGILAADRGGTVVLLAGQHQRVAAFLAERFARSVPGDCGRIVLLPWLKRQDYYRLLQLAGVILDPPHYTAGSSIYDILSFDQPVVTMPGQFAVARVTAAYHRKMNVPELVASSPDEYVKTAVRVANDRDYRLHLRDRIRAGGDAIFNDSEAVREHERFFREVLARHPG